MRLSKDVNGKKTTHVWDGSNIVLDFGATNDRYVRGINLIKSDNNGFYLYNAHGDVVQLTNSSGAIAKVYQYDAFGVETDKDASDTNPFRYCGEYFDKETGTIYLRARYYNPSIGRMLSADSIQGVSRQMPNEQELIDPLSLNSYTYSHNNPVFYVDPSGHVIKLSSDATEEQIQAYERAIAYLKTSETAKNLIERLDESKSIITIYFNNDRRDFYDNTKNKIMWDPTAGMMLDDEKSVMSAAFCLTHEMGHAAQHLDGFIQTWVNDRSTDEIEANNLLNYEIPIGKELGEFTRDHYSDGYTMYRLSNSTDWGTVNKVHSWYYYLAPWNWGTPGKVFENKNLWTPQ